MELNYETLKKFLEDNFDGIQTRGANSFSNLIDELKSSGYSTIGDLMEPLRRTKNAYEQYEANHPPSGGPHYSSIGWVRISLSIFDKKYRELVGHKNDYYHRYEKYIEP